jgi:hypothetical protein
LPKTYIKIEIVFIKIYKDIKITNGINQKKIEIQTTNSDYLLLLLLLLMMLQVKVKWRRQQKTKATHFPARWRKFSDLEFSLWVLQMR